jgi:NADPH:quinone reductase-like Zn-dependent oxidoreductase
MFAAVVDVLGQPPRYREFPEPVPEAGEVIVEMKAAGLHPIVKSRASGQHYSSSGKVPAIPGLDGVGMLNGRLVYCYGSRDGYGTMAERTVAEPERCLALPDGLDPIIAAAIANPGMSAWASMKVRAQIAAGETVLIMGATGVAGQLAIQIARYLGAKKVIAAGRNLEALQGLNVDAVIGLAEPEEAIGEALAAQVRDGIDVVIDYLWGRPTELLLTALAKGFDPQATRRTRLVEVGESAGRTITLPGAVLRSVDLTLLGSGFGSVPLTGLVESISRLFSLAAQGLLKVNVEARPLSQVEQSWNSEDKGKRIVFTI